MDHSADVGAAEMEMASYEAAQAELDRLLNDADTTFDPGRVWALLAALTAHDVPANVPPAE